MRFSLHTHIQVTIQLNLYKSFYCIWKYTGIILNQTSNDILLTAYHPSTFNLETMKMADALVVTLLTISGIQVVMLIFLCRFGKHFYWFKNIRHTDHSVSTFKIKQPRSPLSFCISVFERAKATKKTKQKPKCRFHIVASGHSQDF